MNPFPYLQLIGAAVPATLEAPLRPISAGSYASEPRFECNSSMQRLLAVLEEHGVGVYPGTVVMAHRAKAEQEADRRHHRRSGLAVFTAVLLLPLLVMEELVLHEGIVPGIVLGAPLALSILVLLQYINVQFFMKMRWIKYDYDKYRRRHRVPRAAHEMVMELRRHSTGLSFKVCAYGADPELHAFKGDGGCCIGIWEKAGWGQQLLGYDD